LRGKQAAELKQQDREELKTMKKHIVILSAVIAIMGLAGSSYAAFTPIAPDQLDFYNHYNVLYLDATQEGGMLYTLIGAEDRALLNYVNPETADINGGYDLDARIVYPNGMLDCRYEMAVIATVLKKTAGWSVTGPNGAGITRDGLLSDWNANLVRLRQDLASAAILLETAGGALVPHLYSIVVALITIGDTSSLGFVYGVFDLAADLGVGTFNIANYHPNPALLAFDGDADKDGATNKAEYDAFGPSLAKGPTQFLQAVLNPDIKPGGGEGEGEGEPANADRDNDGLLDTQEDLNGNGLLDSGETDSYDADTDDDGVSDGMEVIVWDTDPLNPEDKPSVPATDFTGLAALAAMIGVAGAFVVRKASAKA
jgi:hypothetical protein